MSFTTLQNTPITLDLLTLGKSFGWTIFEDYAIHEVCNAGQMTLRNYPLISGHTYQISYSLEYINSGFFRVNAGTAASANRTTPGFVNLTITATGSDPILTVYSNANLKLTSFTISDTVEDTSLKQKNTLSWSEKNNKWSCFKPLNFDTGFSLFTNLYTFKSGQLYAHKASIEGRNRYYGMQYKTLIKFTANGNEGQPKTFESLSYEGNMLMITSVDGISTSLGQVSELIEYDFLKDVMDDGVDQVDIYSVEGVFSASFMKDKNVDIINGDDLKGTYIVIELVTTENGILRLKNVAVNSIPSKIGTR